MTATRPHPAPLAATLASDAVLDRAYAWLCHARRRFPPDADVWGLRHQWPQEKARMQAQLRAGTYRFDCQMRLWLKEVGQVDMFNARDALLCKALAEVLAPHLAVPASCTHVKGHGGAKATLRALRGALPGARFVFRTDVRDYYASIDHDLLLDRLAAALPERSLMPLLDQYLRRTATRGGLFYEHRRGIPLGCSLSPLIGAFFLAGLDAALERLPVFYRRFMDDLIVLAATRHKLKRAIASVNGWLARLGLAKAEEKTFIGRVEPGFDFLGYRVTRGGLRVAAATRHKFLERAARLYEQGRGSPAGRARFGQYLRRWRVWRRAGLGGTDAMGCQRIRQSRAQ